MIGLLMFIAIETVLIQGIQLSEAQKDTALYKAAFESQSKDYDASIKQMGAAIRDRDFAISRLQGDLDTSNHNLQELTNMVSWCATDPLISDRGECVHQAIQTYGVKQ